MAMGILMSQHRITRVQAFDLLRIVSQRSNRKLSQIAVEVGDTGILEGLA
jgi:AmiR/NasT family two-component response regulator